VSEAGKHVSDDLIDLNKATSDALLENLKKEAGRLGHTFSESHQLFSDNSDAALFHFASDNNGSLAALVRVATAGISQWMHNKRARSVAVISDCLIINFKDASEDPTPTIEDTRHALAHVADLLEALHNS
jgi:hypothetical protein